MGTNTNLTVRMNLVHDTWRVLDGQLSHHRLAAARVRVDNDVLEACRPRGLRTYAMRLA